MQITIDIPDLNVDELMDMNVLLEKEKNSMEYAREREYRESLSKWKDIFQQIKHIVEAQLINASKPF